MKKNQMVGGKDRRALGCVLVILDSTDKGSLLQSGIAQERTRINGITSNCCFTSCSVQPVICLIAFEWSVGGISTNVKEGTR